MNCVWNPVQSLRTPLILSALILLPPGALAAQDKDAEFPGRAMRDGMLAMAERAEKDAAFNRRDVAPLLAIAKWNTALWCFGLAERASSQDKARAAAERAFAMHPNDAGALMAMGVCHLADWEWQSARTKLERAIKVDSTHAEARHWYALFLAAMGSHEAAVAQSEEALRLDPSVGNHVGLSATLYFARDFARMERELTPLSKAHPDNGVVLDWLGMALIEQSKHDSAIETYREADRMSGHLAEIHAGLGHALAIAGHRDEARQVVERLHRYAKKWPIPPVQVAFVHAGLGEKAEAIRWLQKAHKQKSWELVFMREEPWLDVLREEPGFQAIERSLEFPPKVQSIQEK